MRSYSLTAATVFVLGVVLSSCNPPDAPPANETLSVATNSIQVQPLPPGTEGRTVTLDETQKATPDCENVVIANPAATYCVMMGYALGTIETTGGQVGVCVFPDGSNCDQWAFLAGKCGQGYSYCVQQGYEIKTLSDGNDPYSQEYAVCTDTAGNMIGSVTELSGLQDLMQCGSE